jgi:hypothetical protein
VSRSSSHHQRTADRALFTSQCRDPKWWWKRGVILAFMLVRARNLAIMLLLLVLPWQALGAVQMPAVHDHGAATIGLLAKTGANAASASHVDARHAGHDHHENGGVAAVQGSTSAAYDTCTEVCCSPTLAVDGALALAAADDQGLMIPFAMHRLPSRAPGSLERPPCNSLV